MQSPRKKIWALTHLESVFLVSSLGHSDYESEKVRGGNRDSVPGARNSIGNLYRI